MRAHWRHLANTIELLHPLAHLSPHPKRQIDRFSRLLTAHCRKSLYFTMSASFPQKCPFPLGDLDPIQFMIPWAQLSPQPKRHHHQFSRFCAVDDSRVSPFAMGRPFPSKLPLFMGDVDLHLIYDSLGPPDSSTKTASRSVQLFCRAHTVTDRPRYSVCNNRLHLCT